ncbi:Meprin A subunit alpha, partial [Atta colombica]
FAPKHIHLRPKIIEITTFLVVIIFNKGINVKYYVHSSIGDEFNFELLNNSIVTNYGLPYDYDSIMHYSMTASSTNRSLPTIIPKNLYVKIGQRSHLSYYDIQKLQIAYNCNTVGTNKLKKKLLNKPKKQKKLLKRKKLQDIIIVRTKINHKCKRYINNSMSNKLHDKNDLEKSMNRFNQIVFSITELLIYTLFSPIIILCPLL